MKLLPRPCGNVFILFLAFQNLYNHFDVPLDYFCRRNKSSLIKIVPKQMVVLDMKYFYLLGIIGLIAL